MEKNHVDKNVVIKASKFKMFAGTIILVGGFMSPLLIPVIIKSDLSITSKNILSGLLAFGIPELCMILAVAIMGKEGYGLLKTKLLAFLKPIAPLDAVSLIRYRIGLIMFSVPLLLGILNPYLAHYFGFFNDIPFWWVISLDAIFILSFFVLGGDFWDKLNGLFNHQAKINKV